MLAALPSSVAFGILVYTAFVLGIGFALKRSMRTSTAFFLSGRSIPAWITGGQVHGAVDAPRGDWIVKSVWEHASIGLGDASILRKATAAEVAERIPAGSFAERFVDGREFNLAVLAGPHGPEVLPPAEIAFVDFPSDKPKIVSYPAKWDEASFEYTHTVRRFADPAVDGALLAELNALARRCWAAFDLGGYARVDFRVDACGRPWILEVNTNPCLSPDSGFAAALEKADIPYADAMERITARCLCGWRRFWRSQNLARRRF